MVKSAAIESVMARGAYRDRSFPPGAEAYSVGQMEKGKDGEFELLLGDCK